MVGGLAALPAALMLGTGCTSAGSAPAAGARATGGAPASLSATAVPLREALARESALVAEHERATAQRPELAQALAVPLAHHREHQRLLGERLAQVRDGSLPAAPSVVPMSGAPGAAAGSGLAPPAVDVLRRLRAAEDGASTAGTAAAADAPADVVRLLAGVAASEAQHVVLLDTLLSR